MEHMPLHHSAQAAPPALASRRIPLLIALCALPLLAMLLIAPIELSALPILDDYDAVLGFAAQLHGQPFLPRMAAALTFQHAQYKLIVEQTIVALQFGVLHRINFALLGIVGNLFLFPLVFIFFAQFLPELPLQHRLALFLPAPFLLYQLTYAESVDWGMFSMQTLAVVTFALPSLYFLCRGSSGRDIGLACLFALLAAFSSMNGFFLALVGGVILIVRRQRVYFLSWVLTFVFALAVYLYRYRYSPDTHGSVGTMMVYTISFLGSDFETMHRKPFHGAAIVAGLLMLGIVVHAAMHRYGSKRPFMMSVVAWSLLTAMLVAIGRASMGVSQSLSSRYKIYSSMMLVFCYQYAVEWVLQRSSMAPRARRNVYLAALTFSICFCIGADAAGMRFLHKRRMVTYEGIAWYLRAPETHSPSTPGADPPDASFDRTGNGIEARLLLQQSVSNGDYILPASEVAQACALFDCSPGAAAATPAP